MEWDKLWPNVQNQFSAIFNVDQYAMIRLLVGAVGALAFLIVAWIVAGWTSRLMGRAMERAKVDLTLAKFLSRFTRWLILLMAMIGCLGSFGVETTSFAAVIGAAGLAIGLAFQGALSNFAAGVMLLVFRPFKVGDVVNVAGLIGKVDEIELFTTAIDTLDNRRIIVPNSAIFGSTIENVTFHPRRRIDVPVGVSYSADVDHTRRVLEQSVRELPGMLREPAPVVVLAGLGASSVDWIVQVWALSVDFGVVKQAAIRAVKIALDDAGLEIPFPQMDVHLHPSTGSEGTFETNGISDLAAEGNAPSLRHFASLESPERFRNAAVYGRVSKSTLGRDDAVDESDEGRDGEVQRDEQTGAYSRVDGGHSRAAKPAARRSPNTTGDSLASRWFGS